MEPRAFVNILGKSIGDGSRLGFSALPSPFHLTFDKTNLVTLPTSSQNSARNHKEPPKNFPLNLISNDTHSEHLDKQKHEEIY